MDAPPATIEERIRREAYVYGYAKARELRELGYEPVFTKEKRFLLEEHFSARLNHIFDSAVDLKLNGGHTIDLAVEEYWDSFARGFLDEAVYLDGPEDPQERSRAAYLIAAIPPDLIGFEDDDEDDRDMGALLHGPHAQWARRELAARFKEGRRLGDPPPDMPGYRPRRREGSAA